MTGPLDGVRVIEVASWVAGPSAGAIMADMGADVIKIERPAGDAMRGVLRRAKVENGESIDEVFQASNRGKRSVAVALNTREGAAVVQRLITRTDVLLTNLLPDRQVKYGLDPDTTHALAPRLVHATITGYGTDGPESWRPGYDVTAFFGRGAMSHSLMEPGGPPPHPRPAVGDHTTALALLGAILASMRLVELTGQGQTTDVSLLHTAVWTMASDIAPTLTDRLQPTQRGRHDLITPLANRYPCGDGGWIVVNMPENHWWAPFCTAIGRPDWVTDPRFATGRDRFENMREVVTLIDACLSERSRDEWGAIFDEHGLIWGPVQTLSELVDDPQARAIGVFGRVEHDAVGTFETVTPPMRIAGAHIGPRGRAPETGEHTVEVLAEAGFSGPEIDRLTESRVIR